MKSLHCFRPISDPFPTHIRIVLELQVSTDSVQSDCSDKLEMTKDRPVCLFGGTIIAIASLSTLYFYPRHQHISFFVLKMCPSV